MQFTCTQCDKAFEITVSLCYTIGITLAKNHLSALTVVIKPVWIDKFTKNTREKSNFSAISVIKTFKISQVLCQNAGLTLAKNHLSALSVVKPVRIKTS